MKPKKKKHKTAFCAFLLAALLPLSLKAQSVNLDLSYTASPLGVASQVAGAMYGLDSSLTYTATLRQIAVDSSGQLKVTGGSVTITAGGISITASPVFNPLSFSTYVIQTYTATVLNLTTVAGVSVRCSICLSPSFGGAGIRTVWSTSATAPSDIYSVGLPIATSATGQCFGPFAPGTIFHTIGSGSSAVTGRIQVDGVY